MSQLRGLALSHNIVKPILEQLTHLRGRGAGGWAVAGAPALRGELHKPSFSRKATKNSHGRCATACVLPVPGLFYIAAALGLGPRPCTVSGVRVEDWGTWDQQPRASQMTYPVLCTLPSQPRSSLGASLAPMGAPSPNPHQELLGTVIRSEEVTRRIKAVSVSLSLVRGFAL